MDKPNTISEQLNEIVEEMYNHYCKWPGLWNHEEEGMELCESEHCKECPLNRI